MILQLFKKTKTIELERSYPASIDKVWRAWTEPDLLRRWWGPEKTLIPDCEVDLRVGGAINIVMEAGAGMGRYAGTRWPMEGTFTRIEPTSRLTWEARSWTDGKADTTTIVHTNDVHLSEEGGRTVVRLTITITDIGPKAKMAAYGMRFGYKAQFEKLEQLLAEGDPATN